MQLNAVGIIINNKRFHESKHLLKVFTEEYGMVCGVHYHKKQPIPLAAIAEITWQARLEDHLGYMRVEIVESILGKVIDQPLKLFALYSSFALLELFLLEREAHRELFTAVRDLLTSIETSSNLSFLKKYCLFELKLLQEVGFGLDFSGCPVLGAVEDLSYVSPKSGRAVSLTAGLPYHNRLLPLPVFLRFEGYQDVQHIDMQQAITLSRFFLKRAAATMGKQLPHNLIHYCNRSGKWRI